MLQEVASLLLQPSLLMSGSQHVVLPQLCIPKECFKTFILKLLLGLLLQVLPPPLLPSSAELS